MNITKETIGITAIGILIGIYAGSFIGEVRTTNELVESCHAFGKFKGNAQLYNCKPSKAKEYLP